MNTNHLSQARNVRFYVLILNDAATLILNVGQHTRGNFCFEVTLGYRRVERGR